MHLRFARVGRQFSFVKSVKHAIAYKAQLAIVFHRVHLANCTKGRAGGQRCESAFRPVGLSRAVRQLIAAGIGVSAGDSERAVTISRVYNAKVEWEHTADAVDAVIAVLDHRKRVVRANRAVERWVGVPVRDAVGRDLQYVRMNGTLVGFLAGGALHLIISALAGRVVH